MKKTTKRGPVRRPARPTRSRRSELYSVYKVNEGGMGQRFALWLLRAAGIDDRAAYSPFVGKSGVEVFGGKRVQARAARILFH